MSQAGKLSDADSPLANVERLTPDVGGAVTPVAFNIDVKGAIGTLPADSIVTHDIAAGQLGIENRRWLTAFVVDPSATVGSRGTYSTIQAAITAAVSGQDIFIRPGTYTENLTLKAGVNLAAFQGDQNIPNVTIIGKATASFAGTCSLANIRLQTNSDFCLEVSGSSATIVNCVSCYFNATNNTAISLTSSSASSALNLDNCNGNIGTTGIAMFAKSSAGSFSLSKTGFNNSGGSTTANTISAGGLQATLSGIFNPITTSSTGCIALFQCIIDTASQNVTAINKNGTSASCSISETLVRSGTASAISIGTGATLSSLGDNVITSTNTNIITGLGTFNYGMIIGGQNTGAINTSTLNRYRSFTGDLYSTGISFDSGTNTLSNYAVGTFTPTLIGQSTAGTTTYTAQNGYYERIGTLVQIQGAVFGTAATGTGNALFGGFPFTIQNQTNGTPVGSVVHANAAWPWPASTTQINFTGIANSITANVFANGTGSAAGVLQMANSSFNMQYTLMYQI